MKRKTRKRIQQVVFALLLFIFAASSFLLYAPISTVETTPPPEAIPPELFNQNAVPSGPPVSGNTGSQPVPAVPGSAPQANPLQAAPAQ